MASVRFVFESGTEIRVKAGSDRGAKLMVTGVRKKMESGESLIEVKGATGSQFINASKLAFVEFDMSSGGGTSSTGMKRGRAAGAKKAAPKKAAKKAAPKKAAKKAAPKKAAAKKAAPKKAAKKSK